MAQIHTDHTAVFISGSHEQDNHRLHFQIVAESGGLETFVPDSRTDEEGNIVAGTFSMKDHEFKDAPHGSYHIWFGSDPPTSDYHIWCRNATSDQMSPELNQAYVDHEKHKLQQLAILDMPASSINGTYHLLIGADGVLRSFNRETDLYAHLVDVIAGII